MRAQLQASTYRRGRIAAGICLGYLALVVAAAAYTVYDALFVPSIGASFAGLPLILLTAPSSILVTVMAPPLGGPEMPRWLMLTAPVVMLVAVGVLQAFLGWLVLRGPAADPTRHRGGPPQSS